MMLAELRNESLAFFLVVPVVPSYSQFWGLSSMCPFVFLGKAHSLELYIISPMI